MKILNLLLGMSYNMPNMLSSKFQSPCIKIDICFDVVRENQVHRAWPLGPAKNAAC